MTPAPSVLHQRVSGRIEKALRQWVDDHQLGEVYDAPVDVVLSEHNVVQPDILYVCEDRLGIVKEDCIQADFGDPRDAVAGLGRVEEA